MIATNSKTNTLSSQYIVQEKVTNSGQWMTEKWHIKNKKGYLKIHVAVNVKTMR